MDDSVKALLREMIRQQEATNSQLRNIMFALGAEEGDYKPTLHEVLVKIFGKLE